MFCVNILLTVKNPADAAEIAGLLAQAARLSRAEPGCLRFEVYRSQSDERVFILCERWESKAAWETHHTAEAYTTIYHPRVLPKVDRVPHISTLVDG
ncbi:MAG: antibiotic biosynthesis monooxygenase [Planctomycetia bacterium]|nr:antibiotic biosynthesis monooxygenase [Planctomycetia bacterium]